MRYCGSTSKAADSTFTSGTEHLIVVWCPVTGVSENEYPNILEYFPFSKREIKHGIMLHLRATTCKILN